MDGPRSKKYLTSKLSHNSQLLHFTVHFFLFTQQFFYPTWRGILRVTNLNLREQAREFPRRILVEATIQSLVGEGTEIVSKDLSGGCTGTVK